MRRKSDIQIMWEQEVREKKRIGSNIYSRTGTRGYTGTIRSAHDLLKGKAKKQYEGNSKVVTTNIYDKILPKAEFYALETHIKKNMFSYWYLTHGIKAIQEGMGVGCQTVYNILDELGIERKGKQGRPTRTGVNRAEILAKARESKKQKAVERNSVVQVSEEPKVDAPTVAIQTLEIDGMHLKFKGLYNAKQIEKILSKLEVLVSEEENEFYLNIELVEKK